MTRNTKTRRAAGLSFTEAVSRFRTAITTRLARHGAEGVSSADLADVVPSVRGSRRGAIVRRAFEALMEDKEIVRTRDTVYNSDTHHSVSVYLKRPRQSKTTRKSR